MTAVLLPNGKQQYFTTAGLPAVGYKVATFDAGTSNPRTTWQDAGKVSANTNPIILDARAEASIFWDGTYKVQLQDSTGAVIWTQDGLQSLQNSFSVSLVPAVTNTVDLGSVALSWRNLYLGASNAPALDTVSGNIGYYVRTSAEVSAAITPTNFSYTAGRPIIEVQRYGAVLDGVTDDSAALKNALLVASQVGGMVHIPASTNGMAIASANFPILVYSNTGIIGDGIDATRLIATGTGTGHFFKGTNVKGFYAAGFSMSGTGQGTTIDQSAAFNFQADGTVACGDICLERIRFSNFTAYYWLWFRNTGASGGAHMDNVWVQKCLFQTVSGNCIGPSSIAPSSYCVSVEGNFAYSGVGTCALVRNVWVRENWADCNWNKGFGVAWESTEKVYYTDNVVLNTGQTNSNDVASYAFLIYNNGGVSQSPDPDLVYIERNIIISPRDCGVYSAMHGIGNSRVFIRSNFFSGQNSTATGTLPKGAIALNGPLLSIVEGNVIDSCYWGITIIGQYTSQTSRIKANRISNAQASGQSIYVQATLTGSMLRAEILENYVTTGFAGARGIYADVTSTAGISEVIIDRNFVASGFECIEVSSRSGTALLGYVSISSNELTGSSGTGGAIVANALSNGNTRTRVAYNRINGSWGNVNLINVSTSLGLTVVGNEIDDFTAGTGFCWATNGAQGRFEGNRHNNVAPARLIFVSGGTDAMRNTPNWTGNVNDFVQDLIPTELGSASSKYTRQGWQWDATNAAWKEVRCLTGN